MSLAREISRRLPGISAQLLLACLVVYFAYHAVQGERGLNAWWRLTQKIALAEATLDALNGQRAALEARVALLRPESLDPDMLEERARADLNFGRPDEMIVLQPKESGR